MKQNVFEDTPFNSPFVKGGVRNKKKPADTRMRWGGMGRESPH